ncbi:GNAT family N-acetyltransferase [Mesorhizobium atlanticum]
MVDLLVTYMEMPAPPQGAPRASPLPGAIVARERLDLSGYLDLYRAVGGPVQWAQRLRMAEAELETLLADDATHIHVLRVDGEPAGFCEFQRGWPAVDRTCAFRPGSGISTTPAGTVPARPGVSARHGRAGPSGFGFTPIRDDHPAAQSVYGRAGFRAYTQRIETFPD